MAAGRRLWPTSPPSAPSTRRGRSPATRWRWPPASPSSASSATTIPIPRWSGRRRGWWRGCCRTRRSAASPRAAGAWGRCGGCSSPPARCAASTTRRRRTWRSSTASSTRCWSGGCSWPPRSSRRASPPPRTRTRTSRRPSPAGGGHCVRRWADTVVIAALAALAACGGRREPRYGPVPRVYLPPRPAPAAEPPPAAPVRDDAPPPASAPAVRVGLVVDAPAGIVSSPSGLTVETERGDNLDELQQGRSLAFAAEPGETIAMTVVDEAGSVVGRTRYGLQPPVVVRAADGGVVEVHGTTYRGAILVQRAGRGGLTFVNRLGMEDYLLGVVPRETGEVDAAAYEAVKAQAVAARTYAVAHLGG